MPRKLEAQFAGQYLMLSVLMTSTMKSEPGTPPMRLAGSSLGTRVSAAATYSFGGSAEGAFGVLGASSALRAGVAAAAAPAATMLVRNWRRSVMLSPRSFEPAML